MDLIETFLAYTAALPTSHPFRLWSGISLVAGALERRVWVVTADKVLFPNMYNMLVGTPGTGKSVAIDPAREILLDSQCVKIAPDSLTKAALVDTLVDMKRVIVVPNNIIEYCSAQIFIGEFAVFCPAFDLEFLGVLNYIYDNPKTYSEKRRTKDLNIEVKFPQLNMLCGTQPSFLQAMMPDEAWMTGLPSRLMMVYSSEVPNVDLNLQIGEEAVLGGSRAEAGLRPSLIRAVQALSKLMGQFTWTEESKPLMQAWASARMPPVPTHSKLQSYVSRRVIHMLKLCMISAASRTGKLIIEKADFLRAQDWLLSCEQTMPDIFREMVSKSDTTVLEEMHFYMWRLWMAEDRRPIHKVRLVDYLRGKVPAEKIARILSVAEGANIIARCAGTEDLYVPRPKNEHGME